MTASERVLEFILLLAIEASLEAAFITEAATALPNTCDFVTVESLDAPFMTEAETALVCVMALIDTM